LSHQTLRAKIIGGAAQHDPTTGGYRAPRRHLIHMLRAHVHIFVSMTVIVENLRHTWRRGAPLLSLKSVLPSLLALRDECRRLGFESTVRQIERIDFLGGLWEEAVMMAAIETLWSEFEHELSKRVFLAIDTLDQPLFESHGLRNDTADKFPNAAREISAARKCLALDQPDAAAFHSMRALEIAILILAAELSVDTDKNRWESLLTDIEKEIQRRGRSPDKPPNWKEELEQFYSQAALDFRFPKNSWRNYVMHARTTYGPGEARDMVAFVGKFLDHLASRLHEQSCY
jgi:hypothetical protein